MSRARLLFVDDEPSILSGLRRMLRGQRHEWETLFAGGGEEALSILAVEPVDVIITDMRMPGMDGAQLLARVRELYPATARMVLSGHADREAIVKAVGPTQQYLAKPCELDQLLLSVNRVLAVRHLISNERLRSVLGSVEFLPKPPSVHQEMVDVAAAPSSGIADVVAVVERDLALCAEVLKLVNSAFFGLPSRVETVGRAVSLLGLETIHALAVTGKIFGPGGDLPPALDAAGLRKRAMLTAGMARGIAGAEGWAPETGNQVFLAGSLCEVGLLVLASNAPDALVALQRLPMLDPQSASAAEAATFGCTISEASAYLLGLWGFSEPVVHAIAVQPVAIDDVDASPIDLALSFARRRAAYPHAPAEICPGGYLNADRWEKWSALCDKQASAVGANA